MSIKLTKNLTQWIFRRWHHVLQNEMKMLEIQINGLSNSKVVEVVKYRFLNYSIWKEEQSFQLL